jgi:hypothetical protein
VIYPSVINLGVPSAGGGPTPENMAAAADGDTTISATLTVVSTVTMAAAVGGDTDMTAALTEVAPGGGSPGGDDHGTRRPIGGSNYGGFGGGRRNYR